MSVPAMRVRWVGGIAIVAVGPDAAGDVVPPGSGLVALCAGSRGVVLDFTGYKLASSEFLGHLIRAHQAATASGSRLHICCPDGVGRHALSEVHLDRFLSVFATLAEAVAAFEPPAT